MDVNDTTGRNDDKKIRDLKLFKPDLYDVEKDKKSLEDCYRYGIALLILFIINSIICVIYTSIEPNSKDIFNILFYLRIISVLVIAVFIGLLLHSFSEQLEFMQPETLPYFYYNDYNVIAGTYDKEARDTTLKDSVFALGIITILVLVFSVFSNEFLIFKGNSINSNLRASDFMEIDCTNISCDMKEYYPLGYDVSSYLLSISVLTLIVTITIIGLIDTNIVFDEVGQPPIHPDSHAKLNPNPEGKGGRYSQLSIVMFLGAIVIFVLPIVNMFSRYHIKSKNSSSRELREEAIDKLSVPAFISLCIIIPFSGGLIHMAEQLKKEDMKQFGYYDKFLKNQQGVITNAPLSF